MPTFTWDQICKHTFQQDCWIVVQSKIFDVTPFLKQHPGGRWIILEVAGQDATTAFQRTIHSQIAMEKMMELYIGDLSSP